MTEDILINFAPQETRVAVMYQGAVQELHIERTASRGLVGNIYVGRVVRILPGMQSAFINIGLERTAFLHVADIWEPRNAGAAVRPIERVLFEGQSILVQVIKGTALASVIGFVELTKAGTMITNATFRPFTVYACVALLYFVLCYPVSAWSRSLERKLHRGR